MTNVVRGVTKSLKRGGVEAGLMALWEQIMKSNGPVASDGDFRTSGM